MDKILGELSGHIGDQWRVDRLTVDQVLENISNHLHLSKETETEVLAEIRTHLEDAVAEAVSQGTNEHEALLQAARQFGVEETGPELQEVHLTHESVDAIGATALPVLFAVILRWLVFVPDGSPQEWRLLLIRPGFILLAFIALLFPVLIFHRWRYVLVNWAIFWLLTVIFVLFPAFNHW
jgi:hypothetical protein